MLNSSSNKSLYICQNIKIVDKKITFKHTEISYSLKGEGKAIVFLHGFLENRNMWNSFADYLSKSSTVICIDLPGFGESGCVDEIHSMELMADVIAAVLNKENINKTIIAGHSMGGYASLAMAKKYPDKLSGVILFHSHAGADNEAVKKNRERTIEIVNKNHGNFISNFIPDLFAEENKTKYRTEIQQMVRESLKTKKEGITAALAGMRDRDDTCGVLQTVDFPVLFIVGKEDPRIPLDLIKEQIILPKISESLIIEKTGHMGFIENKDLTLKVVESFLKRY